MVLLVADISLAVSAFNRGLPGRMNRMRMTALALVLAAVMNTITDFHRRMDGFARISQRTLTDLIIGTDAAPARDGKGPARSPLC